ncbi:MAG: hypothetical protein M3R00_03310, partial [Pseudomonadota bacterium]|nr:hypothetical protein [Pseudomonadota bacterium]
MKDPDKNQPLTADQQTVLDFLRENVDFFAAPFNSPNPFKRWVEESTPRRELVIDSTIKLCKALGDDESDYKSAIYGKGNTDVHNSLVYGNDERIIKLLLHNEPFVVALMEFFHEQEKLKLIECWYNSDQGLTSGNRNSVISWNSFITTVVNKKFKLSWAQRQLQFSSTKENSLLLFEPIVAIEICLFILGEDSTLQVDIDNIRTQLSELLHSPKTPNLIIAYTSSTAKKDSLTSK